MWQVEERMIAVQSDDSGQILLLLRSNVKIQKEGSEVGFIPYLFCFADQLGLKQWEIVGIKAAKGKLKQAFVCLTEDPCFGAQDPGT